MNKIRNAVLVPAALAATTLPAVAFAQVTSPYAQQINDYKADAEATIGSGSTMVVAVVGALVLLTILIGLFRKGRSG